MAKSHIRHILLRYCNALQQKYEGAICSIYKQQITSTVPLYLYSNGKKQRLSVELLPADTEWQLEKELGYVYASPVEGAIPLYEAENKNDYCYTTEDKQEYGTKGSWKQKALYVTQCPYNIRLPAKLKQLSG